MEIINYECLIPISIIIAICLPLVPNKKLRYYTCYISYMSILTVITFLLLPIGILRPKNVANMKLAAKLIRNFTNILGIKWEIRNGKILQIETGAVIVANHQSILDIMGMFNIWDVMNKCTVVSKKEVLYYPIFGLYAWLSGLVFIDRRNTKSAKTKINEAAHLIKHKKTKLWIFPEGKRNLTGNRLLPFKKGAFILAIELQVPIIPVVFSPYYFIDSENKLFSHGKTVISALEPIPTVGMAVSDIDLVMEKTYSAMSNEYEKLQREIKIFQRDNSK